MNATLKNESPEGDTYTEKNPRFVPEGRWRMPRPSGTGFFTEAIFNKKCIILDMSFSVKAGKHTYCPILSRTHLN